LLVNTLFSTVKLSLPGRESFTLENKVLPGRESFTVENKVLTSKESCDLSPEAETNPPPPP
jgi:hypothetical protein